MFIKIVASFYPVGGFETGGSQYIERHINVQYIKEVRSLDTGGALIDIGEDEYLYHTHKSADAVMKMIEAVL
jgi:hypothetical protein